MVDLIDGEYEIYAVFAVCSFNADYAIVLVVGQASQLCRILLGFATGRLNRQARLRGKLTLNLHLMSPSAMHLSVFTIYILMIRKFSRFYDESSTCDLPSFLSG